MRYFEVTVKIAVYAETELDAHFAVEDGIDDIVNNSDEMQNYLVESIAVIKE
jgi:hypothetical protein